MAIKDPAPVQTVLAPRPGGEGELPDVPESIPRHGGDGRPKIRLVDDPTQMAYYTRASSLGKVITDTWLLDQRERRAIVWAMGRRDDLVLAAAAVEAWEDREDKVRRRALREALTAVHEAALAAASPDKAATRGTALHTLTERADTGHDLTYLSERPRHALAVWRHYMSIFRVLATEVFVVDDARRTAGTFDRLVELLVEVRIRDGNGAVVATLPPGTVILLDLKSGATLDYSEHAYAAQLAVYGCGVPYVHVDDEAAAGGDNGRRRWPGGRAPSQAWGLIPHIPIDDPQRATLAWVDLTTGARWADLAASVRDERKRVAFHVGEVAGLDPVPEPGQAPGSLPGPSVQDMAVGTREVLADLIASAPDEAALGALYDEHAQVWSDALTAAVRARLDELARVEKIVDPAPGGFVAAAAAEVAAAERMMQVKLVELIRAAPDEAVIDALYREHADLWSSYVNEVVRAALARLDGLTSSAGAR